MRRLADQDKARIVTEVEDFAATGQGNVRRLTGRAGQWRARAGDVRAIFTYDQPNRRLIVTAVKWRDKAYD